MAELVKTLNGLVWGSVKSRNGVARASIKSYNGVDTTSGGGGTPPVAGYTLWLAADNIVGLSDNDPVSTWADGSGNGNDATSSGADRPTYKTNIQNGLPSLLFTGATVPNSIATADLGLSQPTTVFIVGNGTTFSGRFMDTGGTGRQLLGLAPTSGFLQVYAGGSVLADATDHTGAFHAFTGIFDGASSSGYVDGSSVVSGATGTNGMGTAIFGSSAGANLQGYISEVIVYPSGLGSSDRGDVEAYLIAKWAL